MSNEITFAAKAFSFFLSLHLTLPANLGIDVLNPYQNERTKIYLREFFNKYFKDERKRIFLFGINPGRFGGGLTGISFTDPLALRDHCGIQNDLGMKGELSSQFIYQVIEAYGGAKKFYSDFFLTAVCPLGFMKGTVNYNYYDNKQLLEAVTPFIHKTFQQQLHLGANRHSVICIGTGNNRKFIEALNKKFSFFENIIALEHPRFIMQYKRKKLNEYVQSYLKVLHGLSDV